MSRLPHPPSLVGPILCSRVLVGIDGSDEALEAARQAALLAGERGALKLLAAWNVAAPLVTPFGAERSSELKAPRSGAELALRAAQVLLSTLEPATEVVRGFAWHALIDAAEHEGHTLIAVGSHGGRRAVGILGGSTTTELVHKAPCSVLVTRAGGSGFPERIVVGVDGSPRSALAYSVARYLGERFAAEVRPIVATGGGPLDLEEIRRITDRYEEVPKTATRALLEASAHADLVVVGSRGLHGLKALGSVSERVAHEAQSSTLVVRGAGA
jgi:nucleotide-binding universal stress UspA family protein